MREGAINNWFSPLAKIIVVSSIFVDTTRRKYGTRLGEVDGKDQMKKISLLKALLERKYLHISVFRHSKQGHIIVNNDTRLVTVDGNEGWQLLIVK